MDIAPIFQNRDKSEIFTFLQNNAFGLLVSRGGGHPEASHLPYTIYEDEAEWYLYSHMARSNRHVNFINDQSPHLFIVQGVDHYISSTWYDHENVPTWNYIAVHLAGSLHIQTDEAALDNIRRLMNRLEPPEKSDRSIEKLDPDMVNREMRGLVAFRMKIHKVEGARKLSQNRNDKNRTNIVRELEKLNSPQADKMAEEIKD